MKTFKYKWSIGGEEYVGSFTCEDETSLRKHIENNGGKLIEIYNSNKPLDNINTNDYANRYVIDRKANGVESILVFSYINKLLNVIENATECFLQKLQIQNRENDLFVFSYITYLFTYLAKRIARTNAPDGFPEFEALAFSHLVKRNMSPAQFGDVLLEGYPAYEKKFDNVANNHSKEEALDIVLLILSEGAVQIAKQICKLDVEREPQKSILMSIVIDWATKGASLLTSYECYVANVKSHMEGMAEQAKPQAIKTYRSPIFNFTIDYPASWRVKEEGGMVAFGSPQESDTDDFIENVNVIVEDLSNNPMSIKEYNNRSLKNMQELFKKFKVLNQGNSETDGKEAGFVVYTQTKGSIKAKFKAYSFIDNNKAYIITYAGKEKEFNEYLPQAEKIMKSIKIV